MSKKSKIGESSKEMGKHNLSINSSSSYIKEIDFGNQISLTKEQIERINDQLSYSICKIIKKNDKSGTGFFCLIPLSNKDFKIKALITNNHVLDFDEIAPGKIIKILVNQGNFSKTIVIDAGRKLYTNEKFDITIIEIKDSDNLNYIHYLEIDERVFYDCKYIKEKYPAVYIINYKGKSPEAIYSLGNMTISIDYINIEHKCNTWPGSSGSPILELSSFKVMGIHKGNKLTKTINVGTFLKYPIEEFQKLNKKGTLDNYASLKVLVNQNKNLKTPKESLNEIKIRLKVEKSDIGKEVYFLGNCEENKNNTELNKTNVKIYIDNIKLNDFQKYFIPKIDKEYDIKLILDINLKMKNCSYMFFKCQNIIELDLSSFDTSKVSNMNHMFGRCYNVKDINLCNIDTQNVTDMGYLFSKCKNLLFLDLSYFDTEKVETMCCMFHENFNIKQIFLPFFNTEKVKDMSCMFCRCYQLEKLDLKDFDTKNVIDMSHMFDECVSLKEIITGPSFFNTEKVSNMCHMFRRCNNLTKMQFNFNCKNAKYLSFMFSECSELTNIDVSKFKTRNVKDMTYMFNGCRKLLELDLSSFTFENTLKMNDMFDECSNLQRIKVNQNWKDKLESENQNVKNIITL